MWVDAIHPRIMANARTRIYVAIGEALHANPKAKSTWIGVHQEAQKAVKRGEPEPEVKDMLQNLHDLVAVEEKEIARQDFLARDWMPPENFSEYRLYLWAKGKLGYPKYTPEMLEEKVLERFLMGMGPSGKSVRLQNPKTVEDAIALGIKYQEEQKKQEVAKQNIVAYIAEHQEEEEDGQLYAFGMQDIICRRCNQKGHIARNCPKAKYAPNQQSTGNSAQYTQAYQSGNQASRPSGNPTQSYSNQQHQRKKTSRECYVCGGADHLARDCPRKFQSSQGGRPPSNADKPSNQ